MSASAYPPTTPSGGRVLLALAAVYLIWGSTYLAIRFALEGGFPPFLLGGVRFLIAGSLMFAFLRGRGVATPTRAQWGNAAVMGVLLLLLGNGMVNLAEKTVSSGLAAVAGVMFASNYGIAHYAMGFLPGIKAFTAAVLGGIGNLGGAMLGGIVLGLVESLGAGYIEHFTFGFLNSSYQDIFAFLILGLVLIFRPTGLLGERVSDRA